MRSAQALRLFVITSAVQGEGKTMTSLNLAMCCAQLHDMRVLLVDTDIRSHGLTLLLDGDRSLDLGPRGHARPRRQFFRPTCRNLPGGMPTIPPAELLASRRFQEFVEWSAKLQVGALSSVPESCRCRKFATAGCDGVLMVVRAQQKAKGYALKNPRDSSMPKTSGSRSTGAVRAHHHYTYAYQEA